MKLRRPYIDRVVGLLFGMLLLAGAAAVAYRMVMEEIDWFGLAFSGAVVLFGLAIGGPMVRDAVRRFRVDVDSQGWLVRTPKLNHDLRWDEIAAVVIAEAPETTRRLAAPLRLLLVPAAGVNLGVPLSEQSPVDGRAAVELFWLNEVDYGEDRLARDLAAMAGERFHNLCPRPARPAGAIALRRFPDGQDQVRLTRWLDRRRALLFVGWYLLVLVPPLLLTALAAERSELLGTVVLLAAVVAIGAATFKIWRTFGDCRKLAAGAAIIDGSRLVTGVDARGAAVFMSGARHCTSLHSGIVDVLQPGSVKGYGKAWLLTHPGHRGRPTADLLLSDPRTGRLRSRDDLRALEAVLGVSPHQRDRAAARQLEELGAQAPASEPLPSTPSSEAVSASAYAVALWRALKGVGRAGVLLGVVLAVAVAGGWAGEYSTIVGPALLIAATCLFGVWILYTLYRTLGLLNALLTIAARPFR